MKKALSTSQGKVAIQTVWLNNLAHLKKHVLGRQRQRNVT